MQQMQPYIVLMFAIFIGLYFFGLFGGIAAVLVWLFVNRFSRKN